MDDAAKADLERLKAARSGAEESGDGVQTNDKYTSELDSILSKYGSTENFAKAIGAGNDKPEDLEEPLVLGSSDEEDMGGNMEPMDVSLKPEEIQGDLTTKDSVPPVPKGSASFLTGGVDDVNIDDPNFSIDSFFETAKAKKSQKLQDEVQLVLKDPDLSIEARAKALKAYESSVIIAPTFGEAYADNMYGDQNHPKKSEFAKKVEKAYAINEDRNFQARNITGDENTTWSQLWTDGNEVIDQIVRGLKKMDSEIKNGVADASDAVYDAAGVVVDAALTPVDIPDPLELAYSQAKKFQGVRDLVEFINPVEYEGSMEIDWTKFWDDFTGEGVGPESQFSVAMEDKYGKNWELRWAAFLTKEVGVDAAILGLGKTTRFGKLLFAGEGAKFRSRMLAVGARMFAIGIGGASVQSLQNMYLGRHHNFAFEAATRGVGQGAVEGLIAGVKLGIRGGTKMWDSTLGTTKQVARRHGLPLRSAEETKAIIDPTVEPKPLYREIQEAALDAEARDLNRVNDALEASVLNPSDEVAAQNLRELTGMEPEQFAQWAATAQAVDEGIDGIVKVGLNRQGEFAQKAAEVVQKDITRLQRNVARAKTPLRQLQLNEQIAERQSQMYDLEHLVEGAAEVVEKFASPLANKIVMGQAIGPRLIGTAISRQQNVNQIFMTVGANNMNFRPNGSMVMPTDLSRIDRMLKVVRDRYTGQAFLTEPDKYLGGLAKDFFDALNFTNARNLELQKALKKSVAGLGPFDEAKVWHVLQQGGDDEVVYTTEQLIGKGLNADQIDAYYAVRKTLDFGHAILDNYWVKKLKNSTKTYMRHGENIVEVKPSSRAGKSAAATPTQERKVTVIHASGNVDKAQSSYKVDMSELKEIESVLPAHTGYMPIQYKDARFFVSVLDPKTGAVKRVGAFPSRAQAHTAAQNTQRELKDGQEVIYSAWNPMEETASVAFFRSKGKNITNSLSPEMRKALLRDLEKQGIDGKAVRVALDLTGPNSLRASHIGARASERLPGPDGKPARLVPSKQSVSEYLEVLANNDGVQLWRDHAASVFRKEYGEFLRSPDAPWWRKESLVKPASTGANQGQLLRYREARMKQRWLRNQVRTRTPTEEFMDNMVDGWADSLVNMGHAGKSFSRFLDIAPKHIARVFSLGMIDNFYFPLTSGFNNTGRGLGSISKLLVFNVAQILVQGSQLAVTVGAKPIHSMGAVRDLLMVTTAHLADLGGIPSKRVPREAFRLLRAIKESGYLADVATTDLMHAMRSDGIPGMNTSATLVSKFLSSPFRTGEALNRSIALLASRREAIDAMSKGAFKGLDGKKFAGQIDDAEFLRLIADKAKVTALNMGRAGQLRLLSGPGSVLGQFKQVLPKAINIFATSALSPRQKIGAAAGIIGTWGVAGVPLISDMLSIGDYMHTMITDKPSEREVLQSWARNMGKDVAKWINKQTPKEIMEGYGATEEFYNRLIRKGSIAAMTDGEIDISNRIALGDFISDVFESTRDWTDLIVYTSVFSDMMDAWSNSGIEFVTNIPSFLYLLAARAGSEEDYSKAFKDVYGMPPKTKLVQLLRDFGKPISTVGSLGRFLDNANEEVFGINFDRRDHDESFRVYDPNQVNVFRAASGNVTGVPVIKSRLVQYLIGITPGKVAEGYETRSLAEKYKSAIENYRNNQIKRFLREPTIDRQLQIKADTLREMQEVAIITNSLKIDSMMPQNVLGATLKMFDQALIKQKIYQPLER